MSSLLLLQNFSRHPYMGILLWLSERAQTRMVFQSAADRQAGRTPGRDRPQLQWTHWTYYESTGPAWGHNRSAQGGQSNGVGQTHEQHPGQSGGNRFERIGLPLIRTANPWQIVTGSFCVFLFAFKQRFVQTPYTRHFWRLSFLIYSKNRLDRNISRRFLSVLHQTVSRVGYLH